MTFLEIERIILKDGWRLKKCKGSHYHYTHPSKPCKVTISYHGSRDIPQASINTILKQAGLK